MSFACSDNKRTPKTKEDYAEYKEPLMRVNKFLTKKDAEIIESYIKRREWKMNVTETGLWYMIYKNGNGIKAQTGKKASISSKVSLLDGTECYNNDTLNPKVFKIGQGGVEYGLEQGILMLREGDKARFIMPPHLAYGLLGDQNKIPARSIILYEIEVLKIID